MERAFVDTSAWFAYANRQDPDHTRVRNVLRTFQGLLMTSNFIFDETVTLDSPKSNSRALISTRAGLLRVFGSAPVTW